VAVSCPQTRRKASAHSWPFDGQVEDQAWTCRVRKVRSGPAPDTPLAAALGCPRGADGDSQRPSSQFGSGTDLGSIFLPLACLPLALRGAGPGNAQVLSIPEGAAMTLAEIVCTHAESVPAR
jgi:hypothetical protein